MTGWAGRRVLVTGGGGFIGSHLVEALAREGAQVRAFVRYTSRQDPGLLRFLPAELLSRVEVVAGDLRDADAVRGGMRDAEVVFHLGALVAIPYSYRHPREVVETNVMGTLNILEAARSHRPGCVIHTSTSEVYGTARSALISETHSLQAQSPYSASKIGGDGLVTAYGRSFDVPVVTVRPFNTFGPRQSARAVVPTIIAQALTRDEVRLGSLEPTRDYTFVADTVAGFLAVAEAYPKLLGEDIHLGSGVDISIGDLATRILGLIGRRLPIVTDAQRIRPSRSEVLRLCADTTKARERLGWAPGVSLDEGLARTIRWVSAHPECYVPDEYAV